MLGEEVMQCVDAPLPARRNDPARSVGNWERQRCDHAGPGSINFAITAKKS